MTDAQTRRGLTAPMLFLACAVVPIAVLGVIPAFGPGEAAASPVATSPVATSIVAAPSPLARVPSAEPAFSVCVVELSDAPAELKIPWLLLPPESFLPGIAVADRRLLSVLERSGAGVRVLGEYIESDDVYLVQASPFVSQETLSRVGRVLWSSGSTHIISVAGDIRKTAPLPGLRSRLLMPVEEKLSYVRAREWGGRQYERVASSELLPPTPTEEQWIDQMVASVSQAEIEGTMRSLTGVEGVNVPAGLDTIWTRYSYHPDCVIAAEHLYGQFDSLGLDVAFDSFFGVPLKSAAFKGPEGYAAGGNGVVYHTSDGGDTWEKQDAGTGNNLWKASAIAGDTCWISGGFGELIRTSDGGETWEQLVSGTSYYLYGVEFVNSQVGWVCGDGGLIKKSTNGGVDWSTQVSHTIQRLYDIEFTDLNNGWAVGNSGGILRTSDGGANWEVRTDVTTERMYDVCFVDSLHGWVVGAAGVIVHTSDGGEVWQYQYSGLPSALMSVSFVDTQVGWAVGSAGIIMHTENAGATWTQQPSGSYVILYGVCCIDVSHGWAVGNGSVVRTADGETWPSINDNMPDQWRNVVATMTGTTYPSSYYVVCGHYDSISDDPMVRAPGADDNATGASVVLEAARVLKDFPFRSSMKFICFSGEEQGLLGSNHYAGDARLAGHDIDGVLNFDMVGYGTPNIYLYCDGQSEWLANYCVAARDTFVPWLDLTKSLDPSMRYSDHAMFWDRGYSALLGIEIDYLTNPWYHSTGDVMDYLTLSFTTDVARLAVASLASLAGLDTTLISVAEVPPPDPGLRLGRNYPNPFNPLTSIPFSLPPTSTPANYVLAILDPAGRIVRILETGLTCATPLHRTAVWDGTDESGRHVASGVYLSFLRCGDDVRAQKIVLAR